MIDQAGILRHLNAAAQAAATGGQGVMLCFDVERLKSMNALLGFEAALFMPTGTQSNLCALLAHCQRGDEYLVGQMAHTYRWEGGGAAGHRPSRGVRRRSSV